MGWLDAHILSSRPATPLVSVSVSSPPGDERRFTTHSGPSEQRDLAVSFGYDWGGDRINVGVSFEPKSRLLCAGTEYWLPVQVASSVAGQSQGNPTPKSTSISGSIATIGIACTQATSG